MHHLFARFVFTPIMCETCLYTISVWEYTTSVWENRLYYVNVRQSFIHHSWARVVYTPSVSESCLYICCISMLCVGCWYPISVGGSRKKHYCARVVYAPSVCETSALIPHCYAKVVYKHRLLYTIGWQQSFIPHSLLLLLLLKNLCTR